MEFYSQYKQDKFVYETFFKEKTDGVFVEIGADDGIQFSNCYFFEKNMNWTGISFEARKEAFDKLIKNRNCICENVALSNKIETVDFLDIKGYGLGLSGIMKEYNPKHMSRINSEVKNAKNKGKEIYQVQTNTLANLLDKHSIRHVDFLSIDTEGSELKILETVDFDNIHIDVITIEDNYNDPQLTKFFTDRNYTMVKKIACDKIFKKK